ncbi:hypothetical protein D3C85_853000 [compost metagenome]
MRASAIWVWAMVLAEEMSSGRTMPATVSSRTSRLVRTSCRPWMTMLPLGMTAVTTAATVRLTRSERLTLPEPEAFDSPSVPIILAGSKPPGKARPRLFSSPKKLVTPPEMLLLRARWVEFWVWARSLMSILTVRMSPTRRAR